MVRGETQSRLAQRKKPRNRDAGEKLPLTMDQSSGNGGGEVVLYKAPDGEVRVDVRLDRETVWLTQLQMATLFGTTPENVLMHLKNVYAEKELVARSTTKDFLAVRTEGKRRVRRKLKHYNLDAIISVGYRVNSKRGTQFRIWATRTLRDHLLRGYTLNEKRLREKGLGEIEQSEPAQKELMIRLILNLLEPLCSWDEAIVKKEDNESTIVCRQASTARQP